MGDINSRPERFSLAASGALVGQYAATLELQLKFEK
jgi:hypothetical protein